MYMYILEGRIAHPASVPPVVVEESVASSVRAGSAVGPLILPEVCWPARLVDEGGHVSAWYANTSQWGYILGLTRGG